MAFALKIEGLVKKLKKCKVGSNRSKIFQILFDIKEESERYLNAKIDMNNLLKAFEQKIVKNGIKLSKEDLGAISNLIKSKGKRIQHKHRHMNKCIVYGLEYNPELEHLEYLNFSKKQTGNEYEEEFVLPARIEYGCVLIMAGVILEFTGIRLGMQPIQRFGDLLMGLGIGFLADEAIDKEDKKRKKP